jgi:hypothetical protein
MLRMNVNLQNYMIRIYFFNHFQARSNFEYKHKFIQFVTIYHILKHGCLIMNYENMKELFDFLQVPKSLGHHWSDTSA